MVYSEEELDLVKKCIKTMIIYLERENNSEGVGVLNQINQIIDELISAYEEIQSLRKFIEVMSMARDQENDEIES